MATTLRVLCLSGFILHPSSFILGQEVQWRQDYNKARQEAVEKGRPLLIDFGTASCYWCKQLDARTFSDASVSGLLNERFVPLKVDASRNAGLADALHIQNYPTLVLASPDGRILGYQEGFLEAPRLKEQLQHALAAVSAPDWMMKDYEEAMKAQNEARPARAVSLLRNIVEDGKDRPIQGRARQALEALEQKAAAELARAKQLIESGKSADAMPLLAELVRVYAGTQAARDGEQLQVTLSRKTDGGDAQHVRQARELLSRARDDYRMQQFLCCLDRCESLVSSYADLPEAAEAAQLAAEIKSNPDWARQACEQLGDRLSLLYLALADNCLKKGQPQQAVFYLERVVQTFPTSRHAETATVRLAQIQGQPRK